MSANSDLERRIADHYAAEAPQRAPGWVLNRVLAAVDRSPQRRTLLGRPAVVPFMFNSAQVALTAVTIAAIGLVGLMLLRSPGTGPGALPTVTVSSSPSTAARPSPLPGRSRFDSTIHGISIDYPSGWQVRPATKPATGPWMDGVPFDSPAADVIFDPAFGGGLYLVVASQANADLDPSAWIDRVDRWLCPAPSGSEPAGRSEPAGGVGSQPRAQVFVRDCGWSHVATFSAGGRLYLIGLVGSSEASRAAPEPYDYRWLRSILDTVELHPAEAQDGPVGGASPDGSASPGAASGDLGTFAPIAGRIVSYGDSSLWGVDRSSGRWGPWHPAATDASGRL
jgi:hypothetical protein